MLVLVLPSKKNIVMESLLKKSDNPIKMVDGGKKDCKVSVVM